MTTSQDVFEVQQIKCDKKCGEESYYLVSWKATVTSKSNINYFIERYKAEIKNLFVCNGAHKIIWKDTWVSESDLKDTCDEILGAYLLLKLYKLYAS